MKKLLVFLQLLFFATNIVFAQNIKVSGTVTDESGEALIGAIIMVKEDANKYASTDNQGKYSIEVKVGQTLEFSYIGMITQAVSVEKRQRIDVILKNALTLEEVVVVGYGTMKKSDLTGSVSGLKGKELSKIFAMNPVSALQGRMTGVTVENNGGEPGSGVNIFIRGISSYTNSAPLVVINGVVGGDLNSINAADIQSIEVLKDASSCAIYGANGGNGVVLVTTKSGAKGKTNVDFSTKFGANWTKMLDVLYADEYGSFIAERSNLMSNGQLPPPAWVMLAEEVGKGTDWQAEVFSPGFVQDYNLSVSGGSNAVHYRFGGGYIGERGSLKGVSSDKITFNGRVDVSKKNWKAGMDFNATNQDRVFNIWGGGGHAAGSKLGIFSMAMYNPLLTYDGSIPGTDTKWWDIPNNDQIFQMYFVPPSYMIDNFKGNSRNSKADIRSYLEITPIEGLSIRGQVFYGFYKDFSTMFTPKFCFGSGANALSNDNNSVSETLGIGNYWNVDGFITYTKNFNKHSLTAMVGANIAGSKGIWRGLSGTDTPSNTIKVITAASENISINGDLFETANASYFARLNYGYDNRYLIQLTFRRDGTSKFGADYKWGSFPSASAAWRISEEPFFAPVKSVINEFKIRGGYGIIGNSKIGNYMYANYVHPCLNYTIGDDQHKWTGTNVKTFSVPDIKWEQTNQWDVGVEMSFLNSLLSLEYNYFDKNSNDILIQVPLPVESGGNVGLDGRAYSNPYMNAGVIRNWGHEASLRVNKTRGEFQFNVGLNMSFIRNEVVEMGYEGQVINGGSLGGGEEFYTSIIKAGIPIASFYLVPTDGLFNDQEEIDAYTYTDPETGIVSLIQPAARPGDVKFVDTNHDGKITDEDRTVMGDAFPDFECGLDFNAFWKNFDFSVLFTGVYGVEHLNSTISRMLPSPLGGYSNVIRKYADNRWTKEHPERDDARWPINLPETNNSNRRCSDRYMDDGSYFRLKNIQLGYTFPNKICKSIKMEKIRLYVSAQNLFTITKYIGYDPEVGGGHLFLRGIDYGGTPLSRTFFGGIELTF